MVGELLAYVQGFAQRLKESFRYSDLCTLRPPFSGGLILSIGKEKLCH